MKFIVAIPVYNCEKQISRVINQLTPNILKSIDKVIIINNQSKDNSVKVALETINKKRHNSKIEVFSNDENYNLGGSHKVAFLFGEKERADYVAILHGDDQAKASELLKMIKVAQYEEYPDAVLGSRFMHESSLRGYSLTRITGNKALNLIFTLVTFRKTKDLGSGLNLFKLSSLENHAYLGFEDSMTFNIDILLYYYSKKSKIVFAPITWEEKDQVSNAKNFKIAASILRKLFLWRFGKLNWNKNKRPEEYSSKRIY